jgi:hypothetical protein
MKIMINIFTIISTIIVLLACNENSFAQQYKVRQVTSMMNMKSETTIYVKGMRKRTEGGGYAGMNNNTITIEQCDLQRTITINDKKRLYYIDPFSKATESIVYDDEKTAPQKTVATQTSSKSQKGGIVTMWYNITDTGERKKMYGMTARHVWSTQKIKPSADACMKDSMLMKTDGWYIDLPEFNCPVRYTATNSGGPGIQDCKDKFVTRQSGKGKLGFPLIEKRVMIMGNGVSETSRFETNLETLEFSTAKLDSMLFEIPPGYTATKDINDLYDMMDVTSLQEQYKKENIGEDNKGTNSVGSKTSGVIRIGVLEPTTVQQLSGPDLQEYLISTVKSYNIEAIPVNSTEEARKLNCNFILGSNITEVKGASKLGGFLKAVRNIDPLAVSSYNINAQLILSNVQDSSIRSEKKIVGKFEGTANGATKTALQEGSRALLLELK